jgi:superfamily I DNA/RNA helicase
MRFLKFARLRGRECRLKICVSPVNLLEKIESYLWNVHEVELCPVDPAAMDNSKAEVHLEQKSLLYDKNLLEDEKLYYIVHELGHLELHSARLKSCDKPDPVYGSIYGSAGTNSLTRYNPHSREEAQANAFASEFLCSTEEIFRLWRSDPQMNTQKIAEVLGAPVFVVRAQLAEALYEFVFGGIVPTKQLKEYKCNPEQEKAATFVGHPALIDAGPGTGKTATLIRRIEYLIQEFDAQPGDFLVLTFSNEATNELQERIEAKFGEEYAAEMKISTFHGLGLTILQHHGQFQDLDANARVMDDPGLAELVGKVLGKTQCHKILKPSQIDETIKEIVRHITFLKQRLCTPAVLQDSLNRWEPNTDAEIEQKEKSSDLLEVFRSYERIKTASHRLDFADLILKACAILQEQDELREKYREKYKWVLVDEYQDTSRATADLLKQLCGENNPPWVVGDKRQSIFQFCGSNPENVDEFENDFPGTVKFSLALNYRSTDKIVQTANCLADLMNGNGSISSDDSSNLWEAAPTNPDEGFAPVVSLAVADSDQSEYEGIAKQVKIWVEEGVSFSDIAVLARRNIDVRNIVLALGKLDVPAVTSGLVTSEGAAGDLANVLTFIDKPKSSLPRIAYSLGRNRYSRKAINNSIKQMNAALKQTGAFSNGSAAEGNELADEIERFNCFLADESQTGDAFAVMCGFLFDSSDYLRRILILPNEVERNLALSEVVTSLTKAATYSFSHKEADPIESRQNFARYFRQSLSNSNEPSLSPPISDVEAVKVMTCHAAKGLEFPYVIVAGQSRLNRAGANEYKWLPPDLLPRKGEDQEQADSVLFVGATRAQKSLILSHSTTATARPRSPKRTVTQLLSSFAELDIAPQISWDPVSINQSDVEAGLIWGSGFKKPMAARNLDESECSIATYLQDALGLDFPLAERSLYPIFNGVIRNALKVIVEKSFVAGRVLNRYEALQILDGEWKKADVENHSHHEIYYGLARNYAESFARNFQPQISGNIEFLDLIIKADANQLMVRLDLACAYRVNGGSPTAILFRPESLKAKVREKGLLWSGLSNPRRASLVLLKSVEPDLQVFVFSGADGQIYPFQWVKQPNFETEVTRLQEKLQNFALNRFVSEPEPFKCDRCQNRLSCPHWLEALGEDSV